VKAPRERHRSWKAVTKLPRDDLVEPPLTGRTKSTEKGNPRHEDPAKTTWRSIEKEHRAARKNHRRSTREPYPRRRARIHEKDTEPVPWGDLEPLGEGKNHPSKKQVASQQNEAHWCGEVRPWPILLMGEHSEAENVNKKRNPKARYPQRTAAGTMSSGAPDRSKLPTMRRQFEPSFNERTTRPGWEDEVISGRNCPGP